LVEIRADNELNELEKDLLVDSLNLIFEPNELNLS